MSSHNYEIGQLIFQGRAMLEYMCPPLPIKFINTIDKFKMQSTLRDLQWETVVLTFLNANL